jgi:F-type H+-transporting ATPase subunit gamma
MRPYADKIKYLLSQVSESLDGSDAMKWYQQREVKKVLVVVVTSDRGLAGSFNSSVTKEAIRMVEERYPSQASNNAVHYLTIGKKGSDLLRKTGNVIEEHNTLFNKLQYDAVDEIASNILDIFLKGKYDVVEVVYNAFKNAAVFLTTTERFLPIPPKPLDVKNTTAANTSNFTTNYIFEPNKEEILSRLIGQSLKVSFYKYLLESNTAEHGARMTAMDKATENAEDLIKRLKLQYNKERQAMITKEILEIVGGAAALGG